jgi:hypothetical protein
MGQKMDTDRSYFMRRAAQERAAALQAEGKAREVHQLMATRYEEMARTAQPGAATPVHA